MIFNRSTRAKVHEAERLWLAKFILRVILFTVVTAGIGLLGSALSTASRVRVYEFYLLPWLMIPLAISWGWNLANIIVRLSRARPMHPGANVGMDLFLWISFAITAVFAMFAAIDTLYYSNRGSSYRYSGSSRNREYLGNLGNVEAAACAMGYLALLLHFILFVWACVDTHRRNNSATNEKAVKIAEEMLAGMERRGVLPPQGYQQPMQQPGPGYQPPRQSYQTYSAYQPYSPQFQQQVPPVAENGKARAEPDDRSSYAVSGAGEPSGMIPVHPEPVHISGEGPSAGPAHHAPGTAGNAV